MNHVLKPFKKVIHNRKLEYLFGLRSDLGTWKAFFELMWRVNDAKT